MVSNERELVSRVANKRTISSKIFTLIHFLDIQLSKCLEILSCCHCFLSCARRRRRHHHGQVRGWLETINFVSAVAASVGASPPYAVRTTQGSWLASLIIWSMWRRRRRRPSPSHWCRAPISDWLLWRCVRGISCLSVDCQTKCCRRFVLSRSPTVFALNVKVPCSAS